LLLTIPHDVLCRKAKWRIEVQGLVCLLYVAAGAEYPDRLPELTLQVRI